MSSDHPPKDPSKDSSGVPPNSKKLHIWGRPLENAPPPTAAEDKAALSGDNFQQNFPEATGASLSEAVKTIKPEDFLEVHKSACGRQGLMTGIVLGALTGGLRFVWKGAPRTAANWAVGGFFTGSVLGFERCHYLRRLERISMKRIVEVHQADVAEKKRLKDEADKKKLAEQEAAKKAWYKFW
ncbi:uncharacterized protein DNG_05970 [Cephalotrichum gorgonifer]|uniref:Cytochrome c oxidase assembly protein COX20, mitochondrial n=1 Tax=Cephalotrichum gorgonifer TaxID=2041049 RepID=A0AAE8N0U2_9PEZI|nr:uncharacterized protein DNG_05970 [Cephalotrichum gorgonifer]